MKKIITFSTLLLVIATTVVLVCAQAETQGNIVLNKENSNSNALVVQFFYHGNSATESKFVKTQIDSLKNKYGNKLTIKSFDIDNSSSGQDIIKRHTIVGTNNVICILNGKFYLVSIDSISKNITKYINFILDPEKHPNPMLADLMTTEPDTKISEQDESFADTSNESSSEKLFCDTNLHDLLVEIDKVYTFDYIAEAQVCDIYVDANFKKELLSMGREQFEQSLTTILDTYNFYFLKENGFYVIKEKPMIVNESFELTSRIDFNEFISQCLKLVKEDEILTFDEKAQLVFFNGSQKTYGKISAFLKAIKKTYEYSND